ncbi:hypothetical protein PIB30_007919 [Stylosanthes scabra]|uniref:Uncharacterized protein n=1 Tax=Stylosanthes scabra TaxID=79078 RepID=A0ABU6S4P0_9FABA|nr:hypothetical protein [Stylosanthes scabra]
MRHDCMKTKDGGEDDGAPVMDGRRVSDGDSGSRENGVDSVEDPRVLSLIPNLKVKLNCLVEGKFIWNEGESDKTTSLQALVEIPIHLDIVSVKWHPFVSTSATNVTF